MLWFSLRPTLCSTFLNRLNSNSTRYKKKKDWNLGPVKSDTVLQRLATDAMIWGAKCPVKCARVFCALWGANLRIYLYVKKGTLNLQKKPRAKIGTLNLQNEAVSICKKSTCKTRQCLSAKKVRAKRGSVYLQKKYVQNEAVSICKKSTSKNWHVKFAKRGSAYLQKKYAQKLAC